MVTVRCSSAKAEDLRWWQQGIGEPSIEAVRDWWARRM
jgi:hypothetical protein